jgi:hypothetical protein
VLSGLWAVRASHKETTLGPRDGPVVRMMWAMKNLNCS